MKKTQTSRVAHDQILKCKQRRTASLLVEVAVYAGVLVLLSGPLVTVMTSSTKVVAENSAINLIAERNRLAMATIYQDLRGALVDSIDTSTAQTLLYTEPEASSTGIPVPGITYQYSFAPNADGKDCLYRTNLNDGSTSLICVGVDAVSSKFEQLGASGAVAVTLITSGELTPGGHTHSIQRYMVVAPRN
ncbi:MAG: hypothetical protein AAF517_11360 [Planctomycetota bacterium]